VTAGLTAALALLIALLDLLVNNYGTVTIDINGGKKRLPVKGGANLLQSLAGQSIFVPSACGGRGSCGACKCAVTTDVGPILPTELPYLSETEKSANVRLACQIKLKADIAIEIPEELFYVKRFEATVERIRDLTYDIKEVSYALVDPPKIEFKPGQYVQIVVPPYGDSPEEVQRAYSMSSRPSDSGRIELLIRLVPGGIATTWVHKELKERQKARLVGPFGEFGVKDTPATMLCVAGGSGMAPFWSMLRHMKESGAYPEKDIWYFFGARGTKDMFFLDELWALESGWPRFHFVPALSQPEAGEEWKGETGLITDVLDRFLREKIPKEKGLEGYLCGSPGMINACISVMEKNGIPLKDIFFDKFA
jgi:Na+-transporting NADH:ubiquinone oxidoreductase subunit F